MVSVGMNGLNKVKINGIDPLPRLGERISIFFCRQEKTIDEKGEMQTTLMQGKAGYYLKQEVITDAVMSLVVNVSQSPTFTHFKGFTNAFLLRTLVSGGDARCGATPTAFDTCDQIILQKLYKKYKFVKYDHYLILQKKKKKMTRGGH